MAKTRKLSAGLKAWTSHWKKVRIEMEKKGTFKKGDNLTKVFKEAKKTWKSHKKGGADSDSDDEAPMAAQSGDSTNVAGGRKRRGGKTRRHSKK